MGGFKTALKWIAIAIGGLMALLFAAAVFFGLAIKLGMFPETHVQTIEEDRHLEMVEALGNLIEKNNAAFEKTKADAESAAVD